MRRDVSVIACCCSFLLLFSLSLGRFCLVCDTGTFMAMGVFNELESESRRLWRRVPSTQCTPRHCRRHFMDQGLRCRARRGFRELKDSHCYTAKPTGKYCINSLAHCLQVILISRHPSHLHIPLYVFYSQNTVKPFGP